MDSAVPVSAQAPRALVRIALVTTDIGVVPLLAAGFLFVAALALLALAAAGGGVILGFGLRFMELFPTFPVGARVLTALSLVALAAVLASCVLLLWHVFRRGWLGYWSWHGAAWQGSFGARTGDGWMPSGTLRVLARPLWLSGIAFLVLFIAGFVLMTSIARGPFWHAWGWFQG